MNLQLNKKAGDRNALLVKWINIAVMGALTVFVDKYPVLRTVLSKSKRPSDDWDFFMTIAGVGVYLLMFKFSDEDHKKVMTQLSEFDSQMLGGINNLFDYIEGQKGNAGVGFEKKIGFWVLWNIAGDAPSIEESTALAPAIGIYLEKVVKDITSL